MIAAVACAGSGVICDILVQRMREYSLTKLDLSNRGLHVPATMLVAYLLPAISVLKNCNLLKNRFDVELAKKLGRQDWHGEGHQALGHGETTTRQRRTSWARASKPPTPS